MAHLYWRLNISANDGDAFFLGIAEVEMRATISGADQCTGGTATASSTSGGGFVASSAFDDNNLTSWVTAGGVTAAWLQYEFSSPVDVAEYTIQADSSVPGRSPSAWDLEYSDDGIGWTSVDTRSGETGWSASQIRTFEVTAAASSEVRITQAPVLVLSAADSDARITQVATLALVFMPDAAEEIRVTQAVALALAGFEADARITQLATLVLADQVNCLTRWAQCWTITRTDGEVFAFTSLDRALTFRGVVHEPCNSLAATAVELSTIVGVTGSMELHGILADGGVSEVDLYNGLFDGANIEVWMVPWDNSGGEIPFRLMAGVTGSSSSGDTDFSQEILTPSAQLQQKALLETYTPACRYEFGNQVDPRCPVDLVALTVTGSVTGTAIPNASTNATRRIFTDSTRVEADGFYNQGALTWTSGPNAGATSEVKDFTGGQFILWEALLFPIALTDAYSLTPSCDKSPASHLLFNADMVDFGGFPHVPGGDALINTPDSRG